MAYIIVDLEFNNMKDITKYYKDFFENHEDLININLENEIIEIGAVKFDEHMKKIDSMKQYIKPSVFPVINPIVNSITKINMEMLNENGVSFEEAMNELKDMFEDEDILCSWAKDDVVELINNAQYYNYENIKFIKKYLDLQEYATKILGHKKSLSLKNAVNELKIKVDENKLHDASYDAEYTGEVFKRIYNSRIIKNYIVSDIYNMPALNVSELEEFYPEEDKLKLECPKCKRKINRECDISIVKWRFVTIGICPKCSNNVLCEISVKKSFNGDIFYSESGSIVTSEVYEKYSYKLNKAGK